MTPKLVNKAFSAKSTQYNVMRLERHEEPYDTALWTRKRLELECMVTDTQNVNDYRNPCTCAEG
jgi:hypothetical protein